MGANDRQVGGNHYRQTGAAPGDQHWDRQWRLYGRGYFIGQITRYAERYHEKNGIEDLRKINHYTDKLIELEEAWAAGTGPAPGSLAHNGPLKGLAYLNPSDTALKGSDVSPTSKTREVFRGQHPSHQTYEHESMEGVRCELCRQDASYDNPLPPWLEQPCPGAKSNGFTQAIRDRAAALPPENEVDEDIMEAVARGWTHPTTENTVMDPTLAFAIGREVQAWVNRPEPDTRTDAQKRGYSEPDGAGGHRWPLDTAGWKGYCCLKCGRLVDAAQPGEICPVMYVPHDRVGPLMPGDTPVGTVAAPAWAGETGGSPVASPQPPVAAGDAPAAAPGTVAERYAAHWQEGLARVLRGCSNVKCLDCDAYYPVEELANHGQHWCPAHRPAG